MASSQDSSMLIKTASGRSVSLLNDDSSYSTRQTTPPRNLQRINSAQSSHASSPVPDHLLTRQNSYSTEATSPLTPLSVGSQNDLNRSLQSSPSAPHKSPPRQTHPSTPQQSPPTQYQSSFAQVHSLPYRYHKPSAGPVSLVQPMHLPPTNSQNSNPQPRHTVPNNTPNKPYSTTNNPYSTTGNSYLSPKNSHSLLDNSYSTTNNSYSSPKISYPAPDYSDARPVWDGGDPVASVQKRFPCRYAAEFNCDRTFTTSGHASRHAKIHTAEKAVACTWPGGCPKKFTRSDNMKQHLVTHQREKKKAPANGVKKRYSARFNLGNPSNKSRVSSRGSSIDRNSEHMELDDIGSTLAGKPTPEPAEAALSASAIYHPVNGHSLDALVHAASL